MQELPTVKQPSERDPFAWVEDDLSSHRSGATLARDYELTLASNDA